MVEIVDIRKDYQSILALTLDKKEFFQKYDNIDPSIRVYSGYSDGRRLIGHVYNRHIILRTITEQKNFLGIFNYEEKREEVVAEIVSEAKLADKFYRDKMFQNEFYVLRCDGLEIKIISKYLAINEDLIELAKELEDKFDEPVKIIPTIQRPM